MNQDSLPALEISQLNGNTGKPKQVTTQLKVHHSTMGVFIGVMRHSRSKFCRVSIS